MADLNDEWYSAGDALYELGGFEDALAAFRTAFRADRSDHMALMAMANAASEMGQPRRSARYLKMALCHVLKDGNTFILGDIHPVM